MAGKPVRIVVVSTRLCASWVTPLAVHPKIAIVGTAQPSNKVFAQVKHMHPDVIAIHMRGATSSLWIRWFRAQYPHLGVIALCEEERFVVEAIAAGATGCLLTREIPANSDEVAVIIQMMADNSCFVASPEAQKVLQAYLQESFDRAPPLSPREQEVLTLLAHGYTDKEIGRMLNISQRTVKFHVANIKAKFGVSSRVEIVRVALEKGLIET